MWTEKSPSEPGSYWWRENSSTPCFNYEVIDLVHKGDLLHGWRHHDDDFGWKLDALGGEWWPDLIKPPFDEQGLDQ